MVPEKVSSVFEFTVLRHALPEPRVQGMWDKDRRLTAEGRGQARQRVETLGSPQFDLVFFSPALRTRETALIVSGKGDIDPNVIEIVELSNMNCSKEASQKINDMFRQFGDASLEKISAGGPAGALALLKVEAEKASKQILERIAMEQRMTGKKELKILIVGHAVSMMVLGLVLASALTSSVGSVLDFDTMTARECEGYVLSFFDDGTAEVKVLKS